MTSIGIGALPPRASRLTLPPMQYERRTDVVAAMREMIIGEAQEIFLVAAVDGDDVRDVVEVARGDYHSVRVSLPAVLAVPLLAGCSRLVVGHNHPSSRLYPSDQDYNLTKQVAEGANVAGLILQDHLIFAPDGRHVSLRETGVLEVPAEPTYKEVQA